MPFLVTRNKNAASFLSRSIVRIRGGGVIDGDLWWASTDITTVVGSGVIGKYFTANHYDYGYLYTWNYITVNGTNLNGIICPDGWRLPTMNEFVALAKISGFTGVEQTTTAGHATNIDGSGKNGRWFGPGVATGGSNASSYKYTTDTHILIPYTGYTNSGSNNVVSPNSGVYTHLWLGSPATPSTAYDLHLSASTVNPQFSWARTSAFSIRCVADLQ